MKYPQIKRDDKLSVKMTEAKIIEAKQLYQFGWSVNKIAGKLEVKWITVAVYVDSKYENYYRDKYERLGWRHLPNYKENMRRWNKRRNLYKRKQYLKYKREKARKEKNITPDRWRIDQPPKIKAKIEKERLIKKRIYGKEWQRKYRKTEKYKKQYKAYYAKQDKAELAKKAREWRAKRKKVNKNDKKRSNRKTS